MMPSYVLTKRQNENNRRSNVTVYGLLLSKLVCNKPEAALEEDHICFTPRFLW